MEILEYLEDDGQSPVAIWMAELDATAEAKVTVAITRLGFGNTSNVKSVGASVFELKVDFGPGYRVYFGKDGEKIVILLAGAAKKRQQRDIKLAQARWNDYKTRKKGRV